uniref:Uncharacterized protein ycf35 n=1 Tax=Thalassionema nitzschioides TaxID=33649 RepID=A0A6T5XIJ9_9STRA|mmetsp:Transcript_28566/g.42222  ORF Transcript_28566/g.42222 Transcript_28566/m.42222 type:complete len:165 (-) Transcript_28566:135-629(-)|eukprot:CAMPEP_0194204442 /NCGR_PEP_ID=MMETSP0156-20130528/3956_1 /TAXON_ID=33649 /ORGANISM="Thalassionema nitzschioides, Strain L26-B" /LENGTH=164 /DNA_ID=CAMNT_0038930453 /DNA_START=43 /DNA_END=537 /DNA_ORIENTATION=-
MKTFAATVIALAASADAFAPMKGDARASTSLNSHFTSVETKLKNKDTLLKSLNDVGVKATVSVNGEQIEARGYKGESVMADIVIPQSNNYDVAFRYNGNTYELVTDMQFWEQKMPVSAFMEKLNQRYAFNSIIDTAGNDGFNVEKVKTSVDGTVTLKMNRYAFN